MKKFLINNNSDTLLLFFTGWGCDEYGFSHLKSDSDVLILYDYDLSLDLGNLNFSKYKTINLLSYSAGVFVASVCNLNFVNGIKIALNGNPYLFDETLGLSQSIQNILCSVNEENAADFAKNYLVKTEEELAKFYNSKRTIESCGKEFECLKQLYTKYKNNIKDIYDVAILGEDDKIFDLNTQKQFYGSRVRVVKEARHNMFFKFTGYSDFLRLCDK